ncbi:MAG: protein kinase [Acidobacteriota bacterium]
MQSLGKYELIERIGFGGFGEVWRGFDPFIKRVVAIKTCTTTRDEIRDRFFQEAEIAGNLHHRNITTVYDFGIQGDLPYLVQEFLSGEDLDRKIKRREPLPWPEKLHVLLQVAHGLEHAHSRGVVHRDIKPGNLRVLDDGTVKIMDFGIAKLAAQESGLTRTGTTVGTAGYLAPEQVRGGTISTATDVFSFGAVAYELLGYSRPFQGEQMSQVIYRILHEEPTPIDEIWPAIPNVMASLIERCLQKDSERRLADGAALVEQLEAIRAAAHNDMTATRRLSARPAGASATDAAALLAEGDGPYASPPAGADGGTPPSTRRLPDPSTPPPPPRRAGGIDQVELDTDSRPVEVAAPPLSMAMSASPPAWRRGWLIALVVAVLGAAVGLGWWLGRGTSASPEAETTAEQAGAPGAESAETGDELDPPDAETAGSTSSDDLEAPPAPAADGMGGEADAGETRDDAAGADTAEVEVAEAEAVEPARLTLTAPRWTRQMTAEVAGQVYSLRGNRTLELPAGTHLVTFKVDEPGYRVERASRVQLAAGQSRSLRPAVAPPALLTVRALPRRPQGIVSVDGREIGPTPIRQTRLAPGTYTLEIRPTTGDAPLAQQIEVRSLTETLVSFDLPSERLRIREKTLEPPG